MSQHYFSGVLDKGDEVDVLTGWDRPLQQFFLVITAKAGNSNYQESDGIVYSNLFDIEALGQDWEYYSGVLSRYHIIAPDDLERALYSDRENNAGNVVRHWDDEGAMA